MGSNYVSRLSYDVDICFCIDATMSMGIILDKVKAHILDFQNDFQKMMNSKNKKVSQLRVKAVVFRDFKYDGRDAMMQTEFFKLPEELDAFARCIKTIQIGGGGDTPEDGLEAIALAMKSDWCNTSVKKRHVIVAWSDAPTHILGFGRESKWYPRQMPANFEELTEWWGDGEHESYMDQNAKRLLMFAPNNTGWQMIQRNWDNAIHVVTDDADSGLSKIEYEEILGAICNSI